MRSHWVSQTPRAATPPPCRVHPVTNSVLSPITSFTADIQSGTAPFTVQFTDTSGNSPTGWQWSFGDGTEYRREPLVYLHNSRHLFSQPDRSKRGWPQHYHRARVYRGFCTNRHGSTDADHCDRLPNLEHICRKPDGHQSADGTPAPTAGEETSSWELPLIGVVVLALVVIALLLYAGGRSGGRRRSRGGDL